MPTVEEARQRLSIAFAKARQDKCVALKLIHGYGSSGVGGGLRVGIRKSLRKRRKKGEIHNYVFGENWSIFDEVTRDILENHSALKRDNDLDRGNEGISIVVM